MQNDMPTDPWREFQNWFLDAEKTALRDPNALHLATVDTQGNPHSRIVLCKEIRPEGGLVFYTNYRSEKGVELNFHPRCAVNFFWDPLHKQVKMTGEVKQLPAAESDKYWASRARHSQLSQFVSQQSQPLGSREKMLEEIKKAEDKFKGQDVPRPGHWGGYLFNPDSIELWIGQKDRFHDRFLYTKVQSAWKAQRLYP